MHHRAFWRAFWTAAVLLLLGAFAVGAQAAAPEEEKAPPPVPLAQRGPQVGSKIPDFKARDQFDVDQDLRSLAGPNGLVLLFVRSADW